jgi:hypothetical protein
MISFEKILKRSAQIVWNYRILWVFGFLLVLTTGGAGGSNSSAGSSGARTSMNISPGDGLPALPDNAPEWAHQLANWFVQNVIPLFTRPEQHIGTFVLIALAIFLVVLLLSSLAAFVRYPTETAVIRMVDEYERSGSKLGFRQGWHLGWTRRAFRLWLVDLLLAIPALLFVLLILGAGLMVYFSVSATFQVINAAGVVAAIGLGFISLFFLVVVAVIFSLLRAFFARAVALEDLGVWAALRRGRDLFTRNWKSIGLMWLVMVGIGIAVGILAMVVFFLLIPAYLVLLVPALLAAALPALIGFGVTSLFSAGPLAWVIAILAAVPFFFIVLFAPLILVTGWYKLFESNVWTLTYREITAHESLAAPAAPTAPAATEPV